MAQVKMSKSGAETNGRISKLKEKVLGSPALCTERAYLMTQAYRETEGELPIIRRAKALAKILDGMSIGIDEGELIVGKTTSKHRGCVITPEIQWEWYLRDLDSFATRDWDRCSPLSEEEKMLMKDFLPWWKGKCTYDRWRVAVPADILKLLGKVHLGNTSSVSGVHLGHVVVDYEKVLRLGVNGIKKQVEEELARLYPIEIDEFHKFLFLKAVKITLDAIINFARRYSVLARMLAEKERNIQRKEELERIADACSWVPANPARSFFEALQSVWFILIVVRIEAGVIGTGIGRADQYLYPFYKRDIDAGKITREQALELLGLLLIKTNDVVTLMTTEVAEISAGFMTMANITLGGITRDGEDAVNELSYLFLEAEKEVALPVEEFVIRVNKKTPDAFLIEAAEVAKSVRGKIKFLSDDTAIQQLLNDGKPIKLARDYVVVGCFNPAVPVHSYDTTATMMCPAVMLELALNNGVSRLTGEQLGPQTGDPRKFNSFDDVLHAYKNQFEALIPGWILARNIDREIYAELVPLPFTSALYDGCIEKGADILNGGLSYATESHGLIGLPNVLDSLAAIKKVVFEDRKITMDRLIATLDKNYEGEEEVLRLLRAAPKFGNDDDYVDSLANELLDHHTSLIRKYKGFAGVKPIVSAGGATGHLLGGRILGALPDGRKAGEPLAEGGIAPCQGRDVNGPTSALRSVTKADLVKLSGGVVLNMKFNPDGLKDETKIRKFVSMIRTYCETGGYHIQFNIVNSHTLREAQKHPEKYRDLLIRVATYSAYFVELSPRLQNDIIARMEFQEL
jgi:pyruvate formate-lyase/glycerol dehydratase family glycyl radical enzyme